MRVTCSECGTEFTAKLAPCPDGRENCAVAHYNKESWDCPNCDHNMGREVATAIKEGRVTEEPGIGIGNIAAVRKLEIYRGDNRAPDGMTFPKVEDYEP